LTALNATGRSRLALSVFEHLAHRLAAPMVPIVGLVPGVIGAYWQQLRAPRHGDDNVNHV
jgi:hypothetical protein